MTLTGKVQFLPITAADDAILTEFLQQIRDGKKHFRYFNNRPLSIIKNHLYTVLLQDDGNSVGYGHLDPENGKVWLGMAIGDDYRGRGYGKLMLDHLLHQANTLNVAIIDLSVDEENTAAISLYEKRGFYFRDSRRK